MRIIKDIGKAFFVGIGVFIVLGIIQYSNGFEFKDGSDLLNRFLYNQLYSVVLYIVNAY